MPVGGPACFEAAHPTKRLHRTDQCNTNPSAEHMDTLLKEGSASQEKSTSEWLGLSLISPSDHAPHLPEARCSAFYRDDHIP